jgi:hypothetical protein
MCTARRRSRPVRRLRSVWGGWAYAYVHGVSVNGVCDKCTINFVTDRRQQANMQPQIVDVLPPRVRHAVRGAGRAPLQSRPVGRRVSAGRTATAAGSRVRNVLPLSPGGVHVASHVVSVAWLRGELPLPACGSSPSRRQRRGSGSLRSICAAPSGRLREGCPLAPRPGARLPSGKARTLVSGARA